MSVDSQQNSHTNYGFVADKDFLPELATVSPFGNDVQDSGSHGASSGQGVKLDRSADRVRFFRRNKHLSEESSLLESQSNITVAYFTKPVDDNYVFWRFMKQHSCITLSDSLHKIVYLCLIANFILFARRYLECDAVNSMIASLAVVVSCTLTSAAFILIRDIIPRKLPFIFLGFVMYLFGLALLVRITIPGLARTTWQWCTVLALMFVCLGEAALKTVLLDLGVLPSPLEVNKGKQFAWKMHWISNLVIVIIACVITAIQQNVDFGVALYVCICLILVAFILFMIPFKQYALNQTSPSGILHLVWNILREAREVKKIVIRNEKSSSIVDEGSHKENMVPDHWIDFAKRIHGGTYEEADVNAVQYLYDVSVIFVCLIPYWIAHAQCYTTYFYQGIHLDTRIGEVRLPVAWLSLFNTTAVMVLAPLFDFLIYPKLDSWGVYIPLTWRMLLGLLCSSISLLIAGCIQGAGVSYALPGSLVNFKIGNADIKAASLSIFVQLPQYFFLALSEVLTPMTALNIAHRLCHGGFQKLAFGMYFITISLGHIIALIFISFGWYPEEGYFVHSSVQIYFFLLAGLMFLNACTLAIVIYKMIDIPFHLREE